MKIMMIVSDELKQRYVIREVMRRHEVLCVFVETRYTAHNRISAFLKSNSYNISRILKSAALKAMMMKYELRDKKIIRSYFCEGGKPVALSKDVPIRYVHNINGEDVISAIDKYDPGVIAVFGTSMLKDEFISRVKRRIINVHTGLSPYYRGGQAAFWALYNREPQYIGVTIHNISRGIDSGDIILQGRPEIAREDTLCHIECKLAILAADLLTRSIDMIEQGADRKVRQVTKGKLFLSKMFTLDKRIELEKMIKLGLIDDYLKSKEALADLVYVTERYDKSTI